MLRGALVSAEERGVFRGVVAKVVPKFRSGYVPRHVLERGAVLAAPLEHRAAAALGRVIRVPKGKTKARTVPISPELSPWLAALHEGTGLVVQPWVDRVYGKLDEMSFRRAIAKLPQRAESSPQEAASDCHAGVTALDEIGGARGAAVAQAAIVSSVENPTGSTENLVPSPGIEPGTRGFSVRCSTS